MSQDLNFLLLFSQVRLYYNFKFTRNWTYQNNALLNIRSNYNNELKKIKK